MGFIGDRIREERKQQRLRAGDLAKLSGITPSTLWRIESGAVEPQEQTLSQIARVLKIDRAELAKPPMFGVPLTDFYAPRDEQLEKAGKLLPKLRLGDLDAVVRFAERLNELERRRQIAISMTLDSVDEGETQHSRAQKKRGKKR